MLPTQFKPFTPNEVVLLQWVDAGQVCPISTPAPSQSILKAKSVLHLGVAKVTKGLVAINASGCERKEANEEIKKTGFRGSYINIG